MLSGGNDLPAISYPSSFRAEVKKRLTELALVLCPSKAQLLGNVSMLTALRRLELLSHFTPGWCGREMRNLEGQKVVLRLPHLVFLRLHLVENGELILICPKLVEAEFGGIASISIEVAEAALKCLVLIGHRRAQNQIECHKDKLKSLVSLTVSGGMGKQLIDDLCKMTCLQTLKYVEGSAVCLPSSFPPSLRELELCPDDWFFDLPGNLKELHELRMFKFDTKCVSWEITRPLDELLPVDNIEGLQLGCHTLDCTGAKAWRSETLLKHVLKCADRQSKHRCQHTVGTCA